MTNTGMPRTLIDSNVVQTVRRARLVVTLVAITGIAGCAGTPPPRGLLDGADRAIGDARSARAEDHAPVELGHAQERLAAARAAMAERDYDAAARYAQQSEVDARLAELRSRAAEGREQIQQRSAENARLRRDLLGEGGR